MNNIIEEMLVSYHTVSLTEKKNAMKEVLQEIILCSLWSASFFKAITSSLR